MLLRERALGLAGRWLCWRCRPARAAAGPEGRTRMHHAGQQRPRQAIPLIVAAGTDARGRPGGGAAPPSGAAIVDLLVLARTPQGSRV